MKLSRLLTNKYLFLLLLLTISHSQILVLPNSTRGSSQISSNSQVIKLTTIEEIEDLSTPHSILKSLGVPGYSWNHGYNYIALEGWNCQGQLLPPLSLWASIHRYLGDSFGRSDSEVRTAIKNIFREKGIKLLVNAFSSNQSPATANQSAPDCANNLLSFAKDYGFDGINLDFRDLDALKQAKALGWLTQFFLSIGKNKNFSVFLSLQAAFFDLSNYPNSDMTALEKVVGDHIDYYVVKYYNDNRSYSSYVHLFQIGPQSVEQLAKRGIPLTKIVVGKPSNFSANGFVHGKTLIEWAKIAQKAMKWTTGIEVSPFVSQQANDLLKEMILGRDTIEPVAATNLDSVNFWWPPQKTVADIGVPTYAPNNHYNYFIFGTWTCKNGAFDIAKLWSEPSFYLSSKFGTSNQQIQAFLKKKYQAAGKKVLVRAFGRAQSPTSAKLDPSICARGLAAFVLKNNLDGVDVRYMDNTAFNGGIAEDWLISFTDALRASLPFHIISHTIEGYYLNKARYSGGSYEKIISNVGDRIDFYSIVYYGEQHTKFSTYQQLFVNSGTEIPQSSVLQLKARGFDIDKIVLAKPVRLYDAQGAGFIDTIDLRAIILRASQELGWRAGVCYSSYIEDQDGTSILSVLRGMEKTQSIRFTYINNVNSWWPPKQTLAEMGAPTLAKPNIYNYFAYAFWTYKAPLAITKLYDDPIKFFGTELGQNKSAVQTYIKKLYNDGGKKLIISTFGDTEFPDTQGIDPILCANKLVEYVRNNQVDGVDIDFEDSESFINGTGEYWLIVFMQQIRKSLPFYIISHAPQGPYFSPLFAPNGAYLTVDKLVGKFIDFYNIQFYNQGNTTYTTYQELFVDSGQLNPQTSIFQIIKNGISPEKIVLGKPVTQADAYNTGFIDSSELNSLLKQSRKDGKNPGWQPSVMYWHYLSDLDGKVVQATMKGV